MKKCLLYSLLLTLIGCSSQDPIIGTWERTGDDYKGMRIKIEQNSATINAQLIKRPDNGDTTFTVGDIKWKDIKKVDDKKYVFGDLSKYDYAYGTLFQNRYEDSYLTIENNELKTRGFSKGDESIGTEQTWRRIKE